jgi:endonuclease YncB( thermonuclease family)
MKALAALAVLLASAGSAWAQGNCGELPKVWEGQAYAVSGDTLAGIGLKQRIGLWGLKAPEIGNPESVHGMRARAALEDLLASGDHRISCRTVGWDRSCRALAQCTINAAWPAGSAPQPHDIGLRLLEDGMAYAFDVTNLPSWDKDAAEKVSHFEGLARQARKGLWPDWLGEQR